MLQRKGPAINIAPEKKSPEKKSKFFSFEFPIDLNYDPDKSIAQKWREYYASKSPQDSQSPRLCAQTCMRLLMLFQAPTQIYAFQFHIIPYLFEDYSPWTQYYLKLFSWFCLVNGLANWFCVILYSPKYPKSKDNPFLEVKTSWDKPPEQFTARIEEASSQNGHCVYDMSSKEGLPWDYCAKCDMHVPPRAYHCNFCKACILKRDHHCFMVGNCIGFKNQRYFIVLAFYAMIVGAIGSNFTRYYIKGAIWPHCDSWLDLFLPVTLFRWVFGNITSLQALLTFHMYSETVFGIIGFVYFTSQMNISSSGKTLFEVAKKVPIKNMNSRNHNMKSVFGAFWALNFLFPMVLVFRQTDDGIHWDGLKVDHNANKWEDDGEVL